MARRRNRSNTGTSYTGVLRRGQNRAVEERTVSQIEEPKGFRWRIVSAFMILLLSGVLFLFFYSDVFYVTNIRVAGVNYMTVEEVFTYADVANWHIFWITPDMVAENIERYPSIANARVQIGWPPNMVTISIEEREPALVWEQNGVAVWIDVQGNVMDLRDDRADLVRIIVDDPYIEGPLGDSRGLNPAIVSGVLQLHDLRPDILAWRFDPVKGLGWRNANGWDIWLGTGSNMDEKMQIYETLSSDIIARGIQPGEINLVDVDAPFYTVLWGR